MLRGYRHLCLLAAIALGSLTTATADTLYRWHDEHGRPHFSDRPPPGEVVRAEQIEVPSFVDPELPVDEAPYSILNQLRRLEESRDRLAREYREREEMRQRERELSLRQRELEAQQHRQAPVGTPLFAYPRPPLRPPSGRHPAWPMQPHRPPSLWRPDHPAYRPHRIPAYVPYGIEVTR